MSNIVDIVGVTSPEELQIYVEREKKDGWPNLAPDRKAFAIEYIVDYNHRRAAKDTGHSPDAGVRLRREPLIVAYVEYLQSMQLTNNLITKDYINAQYLSLYEMATGLVSQHCVSPMGEEFKAKKTELGTAHNILDKLSKSIDYAKDTGNKSASVSVQINMGSLFGAGHMDDGSGDSVVIDVSPE